MFLHDLRPLRQFSRLSVDALGTRLFDSMRPHYVWILPLVGNYDSDFKGQEYLGLYPTVDKIEDLAGRLRLGFTNVGEQKEFIPLAKAADGMGVYFTNR